MSSSPDPALLQAFEHLLKTLRRTAETLGTVLEKMERGERLSVEAIADYRAQRGLWSLVEPQ